MHNVVKIGVLVTDTDRPACGIFASKQVICDLECAVDLHPLGRDIFESVIVDNQVPLGVKGDVLVASRKCVVSVIRDTSIYRGGGFSL